MESRSTRSSITPLAPSISSIAAAGTIRLRENIPDRTASASGSSGAVPYIGLSTLPTSFPRRSATRNPCVDVRSIANELIPAEGIPVV